MIAEWIAAPAFALALTMAETAAEAPRAEAARPIIGAARMLPDKTIVLDIVSLDALQAHAQLRYAPGDPDYLMVLEHLGGLSPGETKPVPAWPDP